MGVLGASGVGLGVLAGYDPRLAIAAALGAGFVLLVLADLTAGLLVFTMLTFLALLPAAAQGVTVPKLAGLLLAASWVGVIATRPTGVRDFFSEPRAITAFLFLFLAWAGLSVFWSEAHHAAGTAVSRYALNIALFPIIYTAMQRREQARALAGAFVAGASVAAIYGLLVRPSASAAASGLHGTSELDRISGTVGDPNELAAVLAAGIILAIALTAGTRRSTGLRSVLLGAAGLCLVAIFLTLSRGGLIALGCAMLAGVVLGGRWRARFALGAVVAALATLVYFGTIASKQETDRITNNDGGSGRTDIWKVSRRMVDAQPVLGVGAGNFGLAAPRYVVRPGSLKREDRIVETPEVAHNIYLQLAAELGVVGLALFLGIVVVCAGAALRAARAFGRQGDQAMDLLARAVVIALLGILAADFFLSGQYGKQLWLLLAFCPALYGLSHDPEGDPPT